MKELTTDARRCTLHSDRKSTINVFGMTASVKTASHETNNAICVIETTLPPHYRLVQPHWHQQKSETFYVIDGCLTFTLDDQTFIAQRGTYVKVPPATVHLYWNSTASPVTFLTISAPGGLDCFLSELAAEFADRPYAAGRVVEIATRFDQYSPTLEES